MCVVGLMIALRLLSLRVFLSWQRRCERWLNGLERLLGVLRRHLRILLRLRLGLLGLLGLLGVSSYGLRVWLPLLVLGLPLWLLGVLRILYCGLGLGLLRGCILGLLTRLSGLSLRVLLSRLSLRWRGILLSGWLRLLVQLLRLGLLGLLELRLRMNLLKLSGLLSLLWLLWLLGIFLLSGCWCLLVFGRMWGLLGLLELLRLPGSLGRRRGSRKRLRNGLRLIDTVSGVSGRPGGSRWGLKLRSWRVLLGLLLPCLTLSLRMRGNCVALHRLGVGYNRRRIAMGPRSQLL